MSARITVLCLLVPVLVLAALAPAAEAVPRSFFGVQAWSAPGARDFDKLGAGRVGTFRAQLNWGEVEPEPGDRRWSGFDAIVRHAARNRIRVLPTILGSPAFAADRPQNPPSTPALRAAFARFITEAVRRYGPGGEFWRANPGLPPLPPKYWQAWNEPNYPAYWFGRPNAAQYVEFLRMIRAAVKAGDPNARIALAGLPETRNGVPGRVFLRRIYAVPGARALFDVVTLHPYATDSRGVLGSVIRARRTMRRYRDRRKPVWITEIGWATGGKVSGGTRPFKTSERGQARRLERTFKSALKNRRRYRIGMLVWFSLRDRRPDAGERDWWALHTGLFRLNGSAKPAWGVFRRYARRAR